MQFSHFLVQHTTYCLATIIHVPAHYSSIGVVGTELHNILLRVNIVCSLIWYIVSVQTLHNTSLWVLIACHNDTRKLIKEKRQDTSRSILNRHSRLLRLTHHAWCLCEAYSHPSFSRAFEVDVKKVWVTCVGVYSHKYVTLGHKAVGWVTERQTILLGILFLFVNKIM